VLQTLEKSLREALEEATPARGMPQLTPEVPVGGSNASLVVLQYTIPAGSPPFSMDFALLSGKPHPETSEAKHRALTGAGYTASLREKSAEFDARFEATFVHSRVSPVGREMIPFGR